MTARYRLHNATIHKSLLSTVYPEIFAVCIFHGWCIYVDFRVLNFTDTFSQGFSRLKFYAKLPINGHICTRSHGNEGSLFLRLMAHCSYQYKLSLVPQAKGCEHSVLSSRSVYKVVSRSQSPFPAWLAMWDYSQCGYDLPHEGLVSPSQTFLHRALIDWRL